MQEFIEQYGILIVLGLGILYLLTRGRRHLDKVKSEAKDAALQAAVKELGLDKLPKAEKIEKLVKITSAIKNANPAKLAGKAIEVLAEEVAKIPDRDIPELVSTDDDIDGLGAALNKAIKSEEKREKAKRGFKRVVAIGAKILTSVV